MERLQKISEEVIHKNPWYEYKHDKYQLPSGKEGDYYYIETNGMSMIIPLLPDGRVVMVLQYRYLKDKQSIEFPAGGIKDQTESLQAAQDELKEETGYTAEKWVKIGTFEPANGLIKDRSHVFLAQVDKQHDVQLDETEDIEIIYRRPDQIDEMILRGDIWCGQSIVAWTLAKPHIERHLRNSIDL